MRLRRLALVIATLAAAVFAAAACHPGPIVGAGTDQPIGGTLAGIVSTDGKGAVPNRKVTAIDTSSGARFEATTGTNGGYTIKVPQGTYRLELELREGERITKQPDVTRVSKSDLDPQRDFVITGFKS